MSGHMSIDTLKDKNINKCHETWNKKNCYFNVIAITTFHMSLQQKLSLTKIPGKIALTKSRVFLSRNNMKI